MSYYILISYGRKPTGGIRSHPGARQQLLNLKKLQDHFQLQGRNVYFDYQRRVTGLASLPILSLLLEQAKETGLTIMIDDFRRIFSRTPHEHRETLLEDLREYSSNFRDIRTMKRLSEKSEVFASTLLLTESPFRFVVGRLSKNFGEGERLKQTMAATVASSKARTAAANSSANAVLGLYEALCVDGQKVTLGVLAAHANAAGLRTSRGGQWTSSSVHRALKRVPEKARRSEND